MGTQSGAFAGQFEARHSSACSCWGCGSDCAPVGDLLRPLPLNRSVRCVFMHPQGSQRSVPLVVLDRSFGRGYFGALSSAALDSLDLRVPAIEYVFSVVVAVLLATQRSDRLDHVVETQRLWVSVSFRCILGRPLTLRRSFSSFLNAADFTRLVGAQNSTRLPVPGGALTSWRRSSSTGTLRPFVRTH
jgi:hypothetical protein